MARIFSLLFAFIALSLPLAAQDSGQTQPAVLVADSVYLDGKNVLVAEGRVEALYEGTRLKARRIVYDRNADTLQIEGPITIVQDGRIVVLADSAQMDGKLQNGLLRGARMVLDQQVQLAAHQMNRVNGRYSQLYKASVTSCRVCGATTPPLWQIRARRVIHDQQERQLYFDHAQFRVLDVPIFYLPRLRLPDPTLKRASGFLIPSIRRNSALGTGLKVPYFIRMGDHRDLTLTPYVSRETSTLEWRYRQAFRTGRITFAGAVSQDTLAQGATRGYVFGEGAFDLKRDFKLTFDVEVTNDDAYLVDYSYSSKDRLDSEIAVTRTRRDEYIRGALIHYHSLRDTEDNATLPTIIGDVTYERRLFPAALGGELRLGFGAHSHFRYSDVAIDSGDLDTIVDGRDVARLEASINWHRNWTLANGIRARASTGIAIDSFRTSQDLSADSQATSVTPSAAIALRWPWRKVTRTGAVHVIEPVAQFAWVGGSTPNVANDESTRVEFDEGNLLSLSRFPAADRRERGLSAALGASWTRISPSGWQSSLAFGQVIREGAHPDFTPSSGLQGQFSDLLVAGQLKSTDGLSLTARGLFNADFDVTKAEARGSYQTPKIAVGASYLWLGADPLEDRPNTVSEWSVDGLYRLSRHWTGSANWRYDVASNRTAEAGVGLQYRNECVDLNLSLSRRFTSSTILTPSTDISFTIGLRGFSASDGDKSYVRQCKN